MVMIKVIWMAVGIPPKVVVDRIIPRWTGHLLHIVTPVAQGILRVLRSGAQPQLVYFPFDVNAQETGKLNWVAGGECVRA